MVIGRLSIKKGRAAGSYKLNLLRGLDTNELTPKKAGELWDQAKQHKVLFSDYTDGELESFLRILYAPNVIVFEILRGSEDKPVGILYANKILPNFDATGHIAFWDSIARGREEIVWMAVDWLFDAFNLPRLSAEIPATQRGTLRFVEKRLGFVREGRRRKGTKYKGEWIDEELFSLTREEWENERSR